MSAIGWSQAGNECGKPPIDSKPTTKRVRLDSQPSILKSDSPANLIEGDQTSEYDCVTKRVSFDQAALKTIEGF